MLKRLEQKWQVSPLRIVLIIVCFALGGSLTDYAAKKIMDLFSVRQDWVWVIIYILLITIIWPLAVIIVSIFFGQLKFFAGYVKRIGVKLGIVGSSEPGVQSQKSGGFLTPDSRLPTNIAIFASGAGTNAQKIIDHFRNSSLAKIALIVCNKNGAGVLRIAEQEKIPYLII
jgi:hypothetical protein